jgi:hypothetical protein
MGESTSSGAGATPNNPDPGATPTTSASATQPKSSPTTLEEAMARIAELERHASNKTEEAARHGKNLTTAEKELAAYREKERQAQEAALSDAQKLEKRIAEAEARSKQYQQQLVSAQVQLAAQRKGIIDPEMAALAIEKSLEYDENGLPSNLDKALDDLVKNKPYLVKAAEAPPPASPTQTAQTSTPQIPAMNPGRSSIPSPAGSPPPGRPRIPSWSEVYNNTKR